MSKPCQVIDRASGHLWGIGSPRGWPRNPYDPHVAAHFIEPCLTSTAERPPSGPNWSHEIKHDGYRLMARRNAASIYLLTRNGRDWAIRFPLIVQAVDALRLRSCLIDGEAVCCDEDGLPLFRKLRQRLDDWHVVPARPRRRHQQAFRLSLHEAALGTGSSSRTRTRGQRSGEAEEDWVRSK